MRREWPEYPHAYEMGRLSAGRQARQGEHSIKFFLSKGYRESIASSNKAAAKFADVPEQELYEDLKAFVARSAKDGDAPTGCR